MKNAGIKGLGVRFWDRDVRARTNPRGVLRASYFGLLEMVPSKPSLVAEQPKGGTEYVR
jgi:hypothetical protein